MEERCFDLIIRGGEVVDGSGSPPFPADVALLEGRIAAVGDLGAATAGEVLDARGRVVAPGFIDPHTHDDLTVLSREGCEPKLSQGVTTVVVGNCGISPAPLALPGDPPAPLNLLGGREVFRFPTFASYARTLEGAPLGMNVAALVGHGALRVRRMEDWTRLADPGERAAMAEDVLEAMEAGAVGLSTGLAYPTNRGADTAEVVQLAKAAASRGGVLAMHVRDEFDGVMEAVSEAFRCARESGAFLVLSHQKVAGRKYRGRSAELFDRYAKDGAGVPFAMDTYPYTAGSSVLDATWVPHCEKVLVAWSRPHPELAGKDLGAIIQAWGCSMEEAVERLQPAGAVYFHMDQADVDRILASDRCMVGSDGLPADEHPHPRLWGAFARMLADQVRERGRLTLGEAVRRMSALPAQVFGLEGRGRILPGFWGDLVIFDPARIQDQSTYTDPRRPAAGVERVLVNGRQAWPGPGAHGRYLRGGKSPADR